MAALGIVFGVGLAYALKVFGVKVDETVLAILSRLPGVNCGACGKAGCLAFAEALADGSAVPSGCVVSDDEARKAVASLLGIEYNAKARTVATVLCNGGTRAKDLFVHRGVGTCAADALLFGGHKACAFGCLGLGDCVSACPFGAIAMGPDGLPVVDEEKCTACGLCVTACPKGLFVLLPVSARYYVKCASRDAGASVMKVCPAGCIACRKCVAACPSQAVAIETNLARIDPERCRNAGKCVTVCPTKVIVSRPRRSAEASARGADAAKKVPAGNR